jgi:manganese transport protein
VIRIGFFKDLFDKNHRREFGGLEILKYIGPGLVVTAGFVDPGNWATNVAAGSAYGYSLLWVVTLSTVMILLLQHNVAHLGIVTGQCLSEAATIHLPPVLSRSALVTAMIAAVSTVLAEVLGGAIALSMLFAVPIRLGAILMTGLAAYMLFYGAYRRIEKWIIGMVSIIGLAFVYELTLATVQWHSAALGCVVPAFPKGSLLIIMGVLGAVVMPHNLFLHSEVIQSRQWNIKDEAVIKHQLNYEFIDTLLSMGIGWAINCAMILMAAATFFQRRIEVTNLQQAEAMLKPLLGPASALVFALALLFSGISSSITAGMAGGCIFAGFYGEPYNMKDTHSRFGVAVILLASLAVIFFIRDPFRALVLSQVLLSMQLPITIFLQIYLTSSRKVMAAYKNSPLSVALLSTIGIVVTVLNVALLWQSLK